MTISTELRDAARAFCRELGVDPDAVSSSASGAPPNWEAYLPHVTAAPPSTASLKALAEVVRRAAAVNADHEQAERLKAHADTLCKIADLIAARQPE